MALPIIPTAPALSGVSFRYVIRELDQISVAVSVVGTKQAMLTRLSEIVDRMIEAMVGTRPEVKKLRDDLIRRSFNMRRASKRPLPASKAIRAALLKLKELRKLVDQQGLADVPLMFTVDGFDLENVWGYSESEVRVTTIALKRTNKLLVDVGLKLDPMYVLLDPKVARGSYFRLNDRDDVFEADLGQRLSGDLREVLEAVGAWVWLQVLDREDWELWGRDRDRFAGAFARKLATEAVNPDTAARLVLSVGKHARRW